MPKPWVIGLGSFASGVVLTSGAWTAFPSPAFYVVSDRIRSKIIKPKPKNPPPDHQEHTQPHINVNAHGQ